jgi:hypothetical protein
MSYFQIIFRLQDVIYIASQQKKGYTISECNISLI